MIVFDILLVSLKKKHNPQDLSGFMDDLGMVLQKAETINSLTPTFKKYEEVTGAKLNFNKCFVLSTESYQPVGPWAEMARSNYCGDETVYLGVCLSKQLSPLKDWEKVVLKMKKVGAAIKKRGGNFHLRVRMVNTYLTPCMGYLARFKLIPKSVTSLMWKSICSALGAYANTKTFILTSCYPPLNSNPQPPHLIFEKTRILKIKFRPIFFDSNLVFKGVVSNFLMVVKVVILCFFFRYQMHKPSTHNSKSIFIFQRLYFQI